MPTKGSLDHLCRHDRLPWGVGGGREVPVFTACPPPNHCGWPCWHYIQVDCEVTAIETAILGVLPGSVEFLTIPCVCVAWLP